ncbi:conserved protein of unknown function [Petrocella atlantisensis]|uniref:DUF5680 domain-containing protein n=1 Tax=Petrocella atlantisensis TaxID=2173034 RepID=A0A3P7SBP3_9FIRM|nr:DUF5680 domain-containing protein [Petrocella atlantisensis]VDN49139.1 conserved protein of unknown function [Petrocella atlantisensis]
MDKKIVEFLIRAKKATYAGKGNESEASRPNSHDLEYNEGELKYIDTYLGSGSFAGEEALWLEDIAFWSMNYIGRVLGADFQGDFLKEALLMVPEDMPYRGPEEYTSGSFTYRCEVEGDVAWFKGYEVILKDGIKVYECMFHGGEVKE